MSDEPVDNSSDASRSAPENGTGDQLETPRKAMARELAKSIWIKTFGSSAPIIDPAQVLALGVRLTWLRDWHEGLRFTSDRGRQDRAAARLKTIHTAAKVLRELGTQVNDSGQFDDDLAVRKVRRMGVFDPEWPVEAFLLLEELTLKELERRTELQEREALAEDTQSGSISDRLVVDLATIFETIPGARANIPNWRDENREEAPPFLRFVTAVCAAFCIDKLERATIEKALAKQSRGLSSVRDVVSAAVARDGKL